MKYSHNCHIDLHYINLTLSLNTICTYFEEHYVITSCRFLIIRVLAFGDTVSHCTVNILQVVGAKNNTERVPEKVGSCQ